MRPNAGFVGHAWAWLAGKSRFIRAMAPPDGSRGYHADWLRDRGRTVCMGLWAPRLSVTRHSAGNEASALTLVPGDACRYSVACRLAGLAGTKLVCRYLVLAFAVNVCTVCRYNGRVPRYSRFTSHECAGRSDSSYALAASGPATLFVAHRGAGLPCSVSLVAVCKIPGSQELYQSL